MRAWVGISTREEPAEAAEEAIAAALDGGLRADAALLFAGPGYGERLPALIEAAGGLLGDAPAIGATANGVLGAGTEVEGAPAVAVLAIEGCEARAFLLTDLAGHEATAGPEIAAQLGGHARSEDLVVLLPDPGAYDTAAVVESVREGLATAAVVGAGAADPASSAAVWSGRRCESGGLAGIVIRARRPPRIGVTQACRITGEMRSVTRTQGHWILGIDGRPALDVYRESAGGPLAEDLRRAAAFVLVALPRHRLGPPCTSGYVVRQVVGFAEAEGAFALPEVPKPGDTIAFAVREPETAREDLVGMLDELGGPPPAVALYFNCSARGAGFFGVPGLEAAYLERAFGSAPVGGMFGSCEIGPIGGCPELLTHTGVLALLDG
ncbi:MAG: FIST N-terminal domain-containing protein [Myxococcota bacterium]